MKKMSATTTLALLLVLILVSTVAYAAFHWCPDDPVLTITPPEGAPFTVNVNINVDVASPDDIVDGTTRVKVYIPKDVGIVCEEGDGWGGHGETCEIKRKGKVEDGEIKLEVKANVPATDNVPVQVAICGPGAETSGLCLGNSLLAYCEGRTNEWVKCKVELELEVDSGDDHDDDDDDD